MAADRLARLCVVRSILFPVDRCRASPESAASDLHVCGSRRGRWYRCLRDVLVRCRRLGLPMPGIFIGAGLLIGASAALTGPRHRKGSKPQCNPGTAEQSAKT